jgi:transposase
MLSWGTNVTVPIKEIMDTVVESGEVRVERKNRRWTVEEKRHIVEQTLADGRSVAEIARAHGVNANQVFDWRKQHRLGLLGVNATDTVFLPVVVTQNKEIAANKPANVAHGPRGTIRVQMPSGEVLIEGGVELEVLRTVLQCLR